jgi:hypothetical protein
MLMLSRDAINQMGFASVGGNVQISDRASFCGTAHIALGSNVCIDDFCVLSAAPPVFDSYSRNYVDFIDFWFETSPPRVRREISKFGHF